LFPAGGDLPTDRFPIFAGPLGVLSGEIGISWLFPFDLPSPTADLVPAKSFDPNRNFP
jgi:hypothetical protein